jgi:hypothetical protein
MRISGQIHVGEAAPWAVRASKPLTGHPWPVVLSALAAAGIGLVVCGTMVALYRAGLVPRWGWALALLVAIFVGVRAAKKVQCGMQVRHFKRALLARGVPNPLDVAIEIEAGWLTTTTNAVVSRAPLRAISDVSRIGPYWVLLIQGSPNFIPQRYFGSADEERAFLSALRDGLTEGAKARSPALTQTLT